MFVEDLWRIPMSQELATTLTRAIDDVRNQQQLELTLEHLLVSLIDDRDSKEMLIISNIDTHELQGEVLEQTDRLERGQPPQSFDEVPVCNNLKRVMESAAAAARQGGRKEINGAIVLAAIVGDGKSLAADFLRAKGLTFEEAIRSIQRALTPKPTLQLPMAATAVISETVKPLFVEKSSDSNLKKEFYQTQSSYSEDLETYSELAVQEPLSPPKIFEEHVSAPQAPAVASSSDDIKSTSPLISPSPVVRPQKGNFLPRPPHSGSAPVKLQQGSAALFSVPAGHRANPPPSRLSIPQSEITTEGEKQVMVSSRSGSEYPQRSTVLKNSDTSKQYPGQQSVPIPARQSPPSRPRSVPPKGTVRIAASQLIVNMPRRMRVLRPVLIEARIPRSDIKAISEGLQDGGAVYRHEIAITKAISVRLRAPQGGFWIENASPETQWVENILGVVSDDFIRWRWSITPKTRGKKTLQILMSARTLGTDGIAAETALPDQVLQVKVRSNFSNFFLKSLNVLMLIGFFGFVMRHWDSIGAKITALIKLLEVVSRN